ncbi:hypothetical protein H5410_047887 [Solanum commersonii]|uniref:Uncharacterized protein n=1 Tax=Solanum commersonii TaxID=4109 RepID=A0A9J5XI91_SOLCO|nr:hypothetical protein H5410_047887 [Solanum commersonii]
MEHFEPGIKVEWLYTIKIICIIIVPTSQSSIATSRSSVAADDSLVATDDSLVGYMSRTRSLSNILAWYCNMCSMGKSFVATDESSGAADNSYAAINGSSVVTSFWFFTSLV